MRKKRENAILELLSESGRMEVAVLAEKLGISQVTVRKDLDALEERGILRREHGYAVFGGSDDINNRLAFHYEEKRRIARQAAKLVTPGEIVMIENGSCCALVAEELARTNQDGAIITNSAFIASYIRKIGRIRIILLGGDFRNDSQVMVGPILKTCAEQFYVKKLFIGIDGYSERLGFMASDHLRVQAVRDMAEQAETVMVVTESAKFDRNGVVPLKLERHSCRVITDAAISPDKEDALTRSGIKVYKAEREDDKTESA